MLQKNTLDILIPVYNEECCLSELVSRLLDLKTKLEDKVEIGVIFIDDGSKDKSLDILKSYADQYDFFKVISLSRNFGHQMAVTAGLDHSSSDYVAIIDADLQDPPELIKDMLVIADEGYDVVYGKRLARKGETIFKRATAKIFYAVISRICEVSIPTDTGDFRLINKKVANILKQMRERHRFIRGMVPWVGFKTTPIFYSRDERFAGETKYPFRKMMRFAKDAFFSFSNAPLKLANFIGYSVAGVGLVGFILMLFLKFFTALTVPGITAVILTVIILGGIQIIMLGIIGEYVGRIFEESKGRPLYIIAESINFNKQIHGAEEQQHSFYNAR